MLAVKAFYENGNIQWLEKPPVQRAEILVVFDVEQKFEKKSERKAEKELALETSKNILEKYRGCVKNPDFNYEKEREEWLNEKFGCSLTR